MRSRPRKYILEIYAGLAAGDDMSLTPHVLAPTTGKLKLLSPVGAYPISVFGPRSKLKTGPLEWHTSGVG